MSLVYRTRDGKGNDIVRQVELKPHPPSQGEGDCSVCGQHTDSLIRTRDLVSSNFTDWNIVGEYVCPRCADLFSLYKYSYIADPQGIRLLNVRELRDQLTARQTPPFLFCISVSQKKHLFHRAQWNYSADPYLVNLETETIRTSTASQRRLFDFVESLQTLGASKDQLSRGVLSNAVAAKIRGHAHAALQYLNDQLTRSREIQLPLHAGQKRPITEEEAIQCCINSIPTP